MALKQITEVDVAESLKSDAHVLITQKEDSNESLRRVKLTELMAAIENITDTAPSSIYYAPVARAPTSEAEIKAMNVSDVCTFTVDAGTYCICCETGIVRIRDKNLLDVTDTFEKTEVEGYYVYTFRNEAVIPMEFFIYF